MSDINRVLAHHFNQIKEHLGTVLDNLKNNHFDAALEAALNEAETITKNQNSNWKEYWEVEVVGIDSKDYCRLKDKVKGIFESMETRISALELSLLLGGSNTQQETFNKMISLEAKVKTVLEYLEALCALKTFHKSFCDMAEAHGG